MTWPSVKKTVVQQAYIAGLLGSGLAGELNRLRLSQYIHQSAACEPQHDFCVLGYCQAALSCLTTTVLCNAVGGFVRVYITDGSLENSFAISLSLFLIVCTSVLTGTMLPFGLAKAGVDPANAGTSVQVCDAHALHFDWPNALHCPADNRDMRCSRRCLWTFQA